MKRCSILTLALVTVLAILFTGCEWSDLPFIGDLDRLSVKGTDFYRGDDKLNVVAVSIDWAVQTVDEGGFENLCDYFSDLGVNMFVSYASPGLGKGLTPSQLNEIMKNSPRLSRIPMSQWNTFAYIDPSGVGMNIPNGSGVPYSNVHSLTRNDPYWEEVERRIKYAHKRGISLVMSCSFVDVGMLNQGRVDQVRLNEEIAKTAKGYDWASVLWSPVSEAEEGGSGAVQRALFLSQIARNMSHAPSGFHSARDNGAQAGAIDFISIQSRNSFNGGRIQQLLALGKPVIVTEDQHASDQNVVHRLRAAHSVGAIYTITGRNFGMSPYLEAEVKQFAKDIGAL